MTIIEPLRPKNAHIFAKAEGLHYVDLEWLSVRLFEVEHFPGLIWDPFAGWGADRRSGTGRRLSSARHRYRRPRIFRARRHPRLPDR